MTTGEPSGAREAAAELERWRDEVARPWREGRSGAWAQAGRWIGLGLAAGAAAVGVLSALRTARLDD